MKAVLKHELKNYLHSLTAYLFCAFLLIFVGIGTMIYNLQAGVANFEYVLQFVCIALIVIVPVLTMKIIAEEKKQKTDQLLYSLPLKTPQVVIGKYLALLIIFLIPLCVIATYPLIFSRFGEVYLPASYGAMAAFFCMVAAMIAIGTFVSSLTENQGFAAGIAIVIFLVNYFSVKLADYVSSTAVGSMIALCVIVVILALIIWKLTASSNVGFAVAVFGIALIGVGFYFKQSVFEGLLAKIMSALSLFRRFYEFVDGVFNIGSIVFYASVIILFLFLTVQSLEKRRYN